MQSIDTARPTTSRPPTSRPAADAATAEEAVISAMMLLGRRMRQRMPGDQMDFTTMPLLKVLAHQGPMRLSELAAVVDLDASTISRHARHLEDQGLLERAEDPDDRRASRVAVSAQGHGCLEHSFALRRDLVAQAMSGWSQPERDTLRDLMQRLHDDLSATATTDPEVNL